MLHVKQVRGSSLMMNGALVFLAIAVCAIVGFAQGESDEELRIVPSVDLKRYAGTWYEVARLPNRFQKKCAGDVTATYSIIEDGDLQVVNRCRDENGEITEAVGRAKLADKNGPNSKLKVRFAPAFLSIFPFVWGDYWIIRLAPDYTYAVIGDPERKYLWILSRTPVMEESLMQEIIADVRQKGYDVTGLLRTRNSGK